MLKTVTGGFTTPAAGATVQVNLTGAGLATIYSDDGITVTSNPLTADVNGRYNFFVANGRYDLIITGPGLTSQTIGNLEITDAMDTTALGKTPIAFSANNTHSGTETFTSGLFFGTAPATAGRLNFTNGDGLFWRNAANSADLLGLVMDANNQMVLRGGGGPFSLLFQRSSGITAATMADTGAWTISLSLASPILSSTSGTLAASGFIRLASTDVIAWRNNANNGDLGLGHNSSDQLTWPGNFNSGGILSQFISSAGIPASVGALRLSGGAGSDSVAWRNTANSGDLLLRTDSSDRLTYQASPVGTTVYSTTSATSAANITSTTMATASASGNKYVFTATAAQVVAGVGCTNNTVVTLALSWTDNVTSALFGPTPGGFSIPTNTLNNSPALTSNNGTANSPAITWMPLVINAKASTTVSYSTTYILGNGCTTSPTYYVQPSLVQIA